MSVIVTLAIDLTALLPPPPVPGGMPADDIWWRILGILLVSLVTVAIFLYIFRPLTPTHVGGIDARQREEEELTQLAAQLATNPVDEMAGLIPFRPRAQPVEPENRDQANNAATRLRQILGQSARPEPPEPTLRPVRRRLGDQHNEGMPLMDAAGPAGEEKSAPGVDGGETSGTASESGEFQVVREQVDEEKETDVVAPSQADIWGDLGEIARLLPSEGDQPSAKPLADQTEAEADLLGDLVNLLPSGVDKVGDSGDAQADTAPPTVISGETPTEHDLNRLGSEAQGSGKIVPFKQRQSKQMSSAGKDAPTDANERPRLIEEPGPGSPPREVLPITVDVPTREAIEAVVRQLLFYANVGEVLQGFGLYTDEHLRRFMADSGMPEREFQALFSAVPPKQPEDWTRIEFINRIVRLDNGQISADVRYVDGHQPNGAERLTFVQDPQTKRWLIDDIRAI
jgi:hypothetical protein